MKTSSRLITVFAILTAALILGQAPLAGQEQGERQRGGSPQAGRQTQRLADELGVTEEQREQLRQIGRAQSEAVRAIRQDDSLSNEEKRAKVRELNQARQDKIRGILTPNQQNKFDELRQRRRDRAGERRRRGQGRGQGLSQALDLSEEQREQLGQLRSEQRERLQALRDDDSLSPEEKRAKAGELRQAQRARTQEILTPEQREKLSKLRESGPGGGGGLERVVVGEAGAEGVALAVRHPISKLPSWEAGEHPLPRTLSFPFLLDPTRVKTRTRPSLSLHRRF